MVKAPSHPSGERRRGTERRGVQLHGFLQRWTQQRLAATPGAAESREAAEVGEGPGDGQSSHGCFPHGFFGDGKILRKVMVMGGNGNG